ncbi:MAG: helicase-related protein [Actinomycetota bacterium]|nr:helicase-related protein [Actinomycetota bacterium]
MPNQIPDISKDTILEGPFWPERVRVVSTRKIGERVIIEAVGIQTDTFYAPVLSPEDLRKITVLSKTAEAAFTGDAEAFFLSTEAKRIRLAYQFDPLFAVNVSQIDPLPHQIDGVYHFILKNPKIRFLLADDPGAGKTIMAGLVLKELKYRGLVESTLIIVPGHLKEQWLRELKEKFKENFSVVDRGVMDALWGRNVWEEQRQVITSMDFAKQDDVMVSLAEAEWDLVIVDEAHKMSAYKYTEEKTDKTERYKLGELISRNTKFLLFLTATPHRGDPENFRLFLDLLEPGFFATTEMLEASIQSKDNPLYVRRLKEDLKDFDQKPLFPPREVKTIKYRLSEDEKRLYNAVTKYVEEHYNKALAKEKRNVAFALIILQKRLASSLRAIRRSLERRRKRLQAYLELGKILPEEGKISEERIEDFTEKERWHIEDDLLEKLTTSETLDELKEEVERLDGLIKLAREAERKEIETKLSELKKVMDSEAIKEKGYQLLIFTESRDTLEYLQGKIKSWGFTITTIHGGMNLDKRIAAEHEFRNKQAQIMVSTEAGGEGINLQFCWLMVNYDIPWNPNRLEQRMGRIHRYGQQREVHIYNLVAVDTYEGKVLAKLFEKLDKIRAHLGSDRVFDVIGDVFPGKNLKDLIVEAVTNPKTLDDILKGIESVPDEEALERLKEATQESFATRHIDLSAILGEARKAKENRLVPEYIEKFFLKSSEKLGLKIERRKDGFLKVPSVPFELRNLSYDFKTRYGQVFREYNKFSFDKGVATKEAAEFVAPGHPLLEAIVENVLGKYHADVDRGAVFVDPSGNLEGLLWFIEGEIRDGKNEIAGKRLFALYQKDDGNVQEISPSILWDLKPNSSKPTGMLADLISREDEIISFSVDKILMTYLDELRKRREQDAQIKKKYGLKSLEGLILKSEQKLLDYETRRAKGETIPEATIYNEKVKKEDLTRKKERLGREIKLETNLSLAVPKILGVAAVLPEEPADVAMRDVLREDKEIEEIGMKVAMEFERKEGRIPEDVSSVNLGYDIRSGKEDAEIRYIEVKARAGTGAIALTPNEWLMANRLGEEYWLYVVENAAQQPELYLIQSPAEKLKPNEKVEIVRYIVKDWKDKSRKALED